MVQQQYSQFFHKKSKVQIQHRQNVIHIASILNYFTQKRFLLLFFVKTAVLHLNPNGGTN
jgi:hypothetical protein